jgi:hypothetical protein
MNTRTTALTALVLALGLGPACAVVAGTAVLGTTAVVGGAGAVGYTVYKGGEAVVGGVASASSSTAKAVKDEHRSIVISRGTLETKTDYSVEELHTAGQHVLEVNGFTQIEGKWDFLAGKLGALSASGQRVQMEFELLEDDRTEVRILIGDGNLEQSEALFDRMVATIEANRGGSES